ncbi:hypothetical protein FKM82_006307 [Ascaphus truei]
MSICQYTINSKVKVIQISLCGYIIFIYLIYWRTATQNHILMSLNKCNLMEKETDICNHYLQSRPGQANASEEAIEIPLCVKSLGL